MKVDIPKLLMVFDELLTPPTDEKLGNFWFKTIRTDGLVVVFSFSVYDNYVGILVRDSSDTAIASVNMKDCSEIRVLDESKKHIEIIHDNSKNRCLLLLVGDDILSYSE